MPKGEHRPSVLLTREENEQVFSLIGPKCQSLATAVVQLFTTEGPGHSEWKKKDTGVLCLIKDNSRRSYFFRVYCLYRRSMVWEQEIYTQIEYKSPRPYLHTFEAEDYMTAFNFANEDEAKILRNVLLEKIEMRKKKREEKRQHRSMLAQRASSGSSYNSYSPRMNGVTPPPAPVTPTPAPVPTPTPPMPTQLNTSSSLSSYSFKSSGKKQKTRKLTKADIGMPKDFKHLSHVGWNADKGFDLDNMPREDMKSFFFKAGISELQLQDSATREFIYDFIIKNGGINAVKEELHESPPAKVVSPRAPAAPPVPARSPHPPAPPSRAPPPPPAPPARAVPPPPPPPAALAPPRNPPPPRPAQPPSSGPPSVPPPPPPGAAPRPPGSAPPPPPPPPPPPALAPAAPAAPAPPEACAPPAPPMDMRAALMESIRSGNKSLKHVEVASKASNDGSRSNLLSEIRQGVSLRSVATVTRSSSTSGEERGGAEACGLAGALARALQERARAIHSDSDSDSETSDDGEWDE